MLQDLEASDSADAACTLVGLNGLKRMGVELVRGMEISLPGNTAFEMGVFSAVGSWFQVSLSQTQT